MAPSATPRRARGFALIVVLWFLVLIAAIGTYLLVNARNETAIARNVRLAASAEALADAGIAQAVFNLTGPVVTSRWKLDGDPHRLRLNEGEVVIRLSDENAKINPNHASDALLTALFEAAAGAEPSLAQHLGAAIADWVSPGMMPRPLGAKLEQYRRAGLGYGPPNVPVESLDELQLVLGMTPEIFAAVRPYLTIYTESEEPDRQNASPVVQRALLLAVRKPAGDAAENDDSATDDPTDADTDTAVPAGPTAPSADVDEAETVVSVEVTARPAAGGVFVRHAVLRLESDNPKGYEVLDWRRGELDE